MKKLPVFVFATILALASAAFAGSATWNLNPQNNNWFTAANWTPATVPNSAADVATFGVTNVANISGFALNLSEVVFSPGASTYVITIPLGDIHTISGPGITNRAGTQKFTISAGDGDGTFGDLTFTGNATAGTSTQFTINGTNDPNSFAGEIIFHDNASADLGTYSLLPGSRQGGNVLFYDHATAGMGYFYDAGEVAFSETSSAGEGYFEVAGGDSAGAAGGYLALANGSRGGSAQFIVDAGTVSGALGGVMVISDSASTEDAQIFANDGPGDGGLVRFLYSSATAGGMATFQLNGKGHMDISGAGKNPSIGALSGTGPVFLGSRKLTAGRNLMSTTYSGVLQDGGISGGIGGSFAKVGSGTLTLSGANTYTGATSLNGGTLKLINTTGSATGTGPVQANAGDLGGNAIVAGPVTIGANNSDRPHLSPATGGKVPGSLTILSPLTFNSNGGYDLLIRASGRRILADRVTANGVTINIGASITLLATVKGNLPPGTSATVLGNSSTSPISGAFSNLADGAVVTIGATKFQANYEGGDGNDLTLTVVP